jgi:hypothetical protein
MMTRIALVLSLALFALPGCKKKDDAAATGGAAADKAEKVAAGADKPAAAGPAKTNPKDLFAEFTDPKADGMKLLDKYREGATFSGKVSVKGAEESGKPILWIDIDGKNHMTLDYTDVAQAKAVKDGDTVNVTCKIGGASGTLMMVTDCAAAK